jgi:TetR/AcrR family transcriptional regulator
VEEKAKVIDYWVAAGEMLPLPTPHLFFVLWAATQTYADFEPQMRAVLKRKRLAPADY